MAYSLQALQHKFYMHFSSPLCMLHAQPIFSCTYWRVQHALKRLFGRVTRALFEQWKVKYMRTGVIVQCRNQIRGLASDRKQLIHEWELCRCLICYCVYCFYWAYTEKVRPLFYRLYFVISRRYCTHILYSTVMLSRNTFPAIPVFLTI